ncbi:MAG: DNA adenine methylase, partial [Pseudomonadota bacterium]
LYNNINYMLDEIYLKSKLKKKTKLIIEDDSDTEENKINNITNQSFKKHLKPLIKWSGGKSDEIKMFEKYFPEHYSTYIEPFVGGGSVYFYLNPVKAVISDVHKELIDLYKIKNKTTNTSSTQYKNVHENRNYNPISLWFNSFGRQATY